MSKPEIALVRASGRATCPICNQLINKNESQVTIKFADGHVYTHQCRIHKSCIIKLKIEGEETE